MRTTHATAPPRITALLLVGFTTTALAQVPTLPRSSISNAADAGQLAHTNLQILTSSGNFTTAAPQAIGAPFAGYLYQTPASIACIYNLQPAVSGCNPNVASSNPSGGSRAIAIVDAYDDPNAFADLQFFSKQFGLAAITPSTFHVVFAPQGGSLPGSCVGPATTPKSALNTGWDIEESLDIEWSHAMAPLATLYLVEAQSNSLPDLFCAVSVAGNLVNAAGGGEVSMSWGSGDFPVESFADSVFTSPNVVYFASAGDFPGVQYPSASPNVVAVGGTSLSFDPTTGNLIGENTWQNTGGGASRFESRPSYQDGNIAPIVGLQRGTPDVASDANPNTGAWVWDSLGAPPGGSWYIVGGTSLSSPTWAGIVNAAGRFYPSSQAELTALYSDPSADFSPIKVGNCGPYMSIFASGNWDFCSGRGSPNGYRGK
jgi:kumamolisin